MVLSLIESQEKDLHFRNIKDSLEKYRSKRSEEIKEQILRNIRIYGVRGCGVLPGKIADMIGFNKKNILPYLNMLEEEKKIKRENEQAPYFPTDEYYKDPLLDARLFGESSSCLSKEWILILSNERRIGFQKEGSSLFLEW